MSIIELVAGRSRLTVNPVGASVRSLGLDGVSVIPAYPVGPPPLSAGVVLVPWVNRIDRGQWSYRGALQQLEVTEPALDTAIHGLLASHEYECTHVDEGSVELSAPVGPVAGYPFRLETAARYELDSVGFSAVHSVTNVGTDAAPVALGIHPYFLIDGRPIADHVLTIAADTEIVLDERYLPVGSRDVQPPNDYRAGLGVKPAGVHVALTDLARAPGMPDRIEHHLAIPDGPAIRVWTDAAFSYVQLYLATEFPLASGGTAAALAIEPLTAPANALASGEALTWIEPGATFTARWGVSLG